MTSSDPIAQLIIDAARRVLTRRAVSLRKTAADLTTQIEHHGRTIPIAAPEASVALETARLFEACATDLDAMNPTVAAAHV